MYNIIPSKKRASLIDITLSMFSNPNSGVGSGGANNKASANKTNSNGRHGNTTSAVEEEDEGVYDENFTSRPLRSSHTNLHSMSASSTRTNATNTVTSNATTSTTTAARGSLWSVLGLSGTSKSEPDVQREYIQ